MADPNGDGGPLIVPIEVDALAVNEAVRGDSFRRWQLDCHRLEHQRNPEPDPFEMDDTAVTGRSASDGVYLHWRLPEALCRGRVDPDTGTVGYPKVPNRWLVVRYAGEGTHDRLRAGSPKATTSTRTTAQARTCIPPLVRRPGSAVGTT